MLDSTACLGILGTVGGKVVPGRDGREAFYSLAAVEIKVRSN